MNGALARGAWFRICQIVSSRKTYNSRGDSLCGIDAPSRLVIILRQGRFGPGSVIPDRHLHPDHEPFLPQPVSVCPR